MPCCFWNNAPPSQGRSLRANQVLVVHHAPHPEELVRAQLVHHEEVPVEARLLVHAAHLVPRDAECPEARVHLRGHAQLLQAHPQEHVVYGVQLHVLRGHVEPPGQLGGHEEPPAAHIGRVRLVVQLFGDVVFALPVADGDGLGDGVPHEQLGLSALLHPEADELQQVARVHVHVVVPLEYELHPGAVDFEPFEEVDLLQGQVEKRVHEVPLQDVLVDHVLILEQLLEVLGVRRRGSEQEQGSDLLAVHGQLPAPGFTHGLAPVVLLDDGLDDHEEVDVSLCALLRVVDEHGEVPAVSVQDELLKARVQTSEPVLAPHRRVLAAVQNLCAPGARSLSHRLLLLLRVLVARTRGLCAPEAGVDDPLLCKAL